MHSIPITIAILCPPKDDLYAHLAQAAYTLREYDVVALSSKVVAIGEGRCIAKSEAGSREALATREADAFIPRDASGGHTLITRVGSALVGFAGIDPLGDYYVLWPRDPMQSAERLLAWFKTRFAIHNLGVVITDSHSTPMRRGVIGFAIGWAGFAPLVDSGKTKDFFGGMTTGTTINLPDAFAAAANLVMGEANEQTPLVIMRDAPYMRDTQAPRAGKEGAFEVAPEEDMYAPLFTSAPWEKGRRG